jgi:hypothetical protein
VVAPLLGAGSALALVLQWHDPAAVQLWVTLLGCAVCLAGVLEPEES